MRGRVGIVWLGLAAGMVIPEVGVCQPLPTVWNTHEELMNWVPDDAEVRAHVERRSELGRAFIRLKPPLFWLVLGPGRQLPDFLNPGAEYVLADPQDLNAVRLTVRNGLATTTFIGGFWSHVAAVYGEGLEELPYFVRHTVPHDGEWHEVTLHLSDSPFVEWQQPIFAFWLGPVVPRNRPEEDVGALADALGAEPAVAFIDVDRVEFVHIEEALAVPVITSFEPVEGEAGVELEIVGSGFRDGLGANLVRVGAGQKEAVMVSAQPDRLVVRVPPSTTGPISVSTAGGSVTTEASFRVVGPAERLRVVSGDGQTGVVGSRLQPLVVEVLDGEGNALAQQIVYFALAMGAGRLEATSVETDELGRASTVLVLGQEPGAVKVTARSPSVLPVEFELTATPPEG